MSLYYKLNYLFLNIMVLNILKFLYIFKFSHVQNEAMSHCTSLTKKGLIILPTYIWY